MADNSKSSFTYNGAKAANGSIISSSNMEMHPPIPTVVTLSSLVREKCQLVKVQVRKAVYPNTFTDEEVVLKEKLARVLEDMMKPKLVLELEEVVCMH